MESFILLVLVLLTFYPVVLLCRFLRLGIKVCKMILRNDGFPVIDVTDYVNEDSLNNN